MAPITSEAMNNWPRMRSDLKMMDPVSIEMPALVWWSFFLGYMNHEWTDQYANFICDHIQHALLDPIYIREMMAQVQLQRDQQEQMEKAHKKMLQQAGVLPPDPPEDQLFPPDTGP